MFSFKALITENFVNLEENYRLNKRGGILSDTDFEILKSFNWDSAIDLQQQKELDNILGFFASYVYFEDFPRTSNLVFNEKTSFFTK